MEIKTKNYSTTSLIIIVLLLAVLFVFIDYKLLLLNKPIALFSIVTFISFCLWVIDEYLWCIPPFKWFLKIPKIKGRYCGQLISSFIDTETNQNTVKEVVIEITQSFSSISISMFFVQNNTKNITSNSRSILENIENEKDGSYYIYFTYFNEPMLPSGLIKHYGTCKLKYLPSELKLTGTYYNDKGNNGSIEVTFESSELKGMY